MDWRSLAGASMVWERWRIGHYSSRYNGVTRQSQGHIHLGVWIIDNVRMYIFNSKRNEACMAQSPSSNSVFSDIGDTTKKYFYTTNLGN